MAIPTPDIFYDGTANRDVGVAFARDIKLLDQRSENTSPDAPFSTGGNLTGDMNLLDALRSFDTFNQSHDSEISNLTDRVTDLETFEGIFPTRGGENEGQVLVWDNDAGAFVFEDKDEPSHTTFLEHSDTPNSWGAVGQILQVNASGNGLEWTNKPTGGGGGGTAFDGNLTGSLSQTGDKITLNHGATGNLNAIGEIVFTNGYRDSGGTLQDGGLVYSASNRGELQIRRNNSLTHLLHGESEASAYPSAITNRWLPTGGRWAKTQVPSDTIYTDSTRILPASIGNNRQVLTSDGTNAVWEDAPSGLPSTSGASQGEVLKLNASLTPIWDTDQRGSGGTTLPANSEGFLRNNGTGTLTWTSPFPSNNLTNLAGNLRFFVQDPDGPSNDGTSTDGYFSMTQVRNNISIHGYDVDASAMDRDDRLRVFQSTNARSSLISNVLELAQWDDMTDVQDISSGVAGQFPVINLSGNAIEWETQPVPFQLGNAATQFLSHARLQHHSVNNTAYQGDFSPGVFQWNWRDVNARTGFFQAGGDETAMGVSQSGGIITGLPTADTFDASVLTMIWFEFASAPGANQIVCEFHNRGSERGNGNSAVSPILVTDSAGRLCIQRPGAGQSQTSGPVSGQFRRIHAITNTDVFFTPAAGDKVGINPLAFGVGMGFEVWYYDADGGPRENPGELYQCNDIEFSTAIRTQFEITNNLGGGFSSAEELQARRVFSVQDIESHTSSGLSKVYGFRHTHYDTHQDVYNYVVNHIDDPFLGIKHTTTSAWDTPGFDGDLTITGNLGVEGAVTVTGNLNVHGTTTTRDSQHLNIGDNIITLNHGETGSPTEDAGIEVERGTADNARFIWDEQNDEFAIGTTTLSPILTRNSTEDRFSSSLRNRLVPNTGTGVLVASSANNFAFGNVPVGNIPNLPATKITTETFDENRIPDISLEKIHNYPRIAQPIETGDPILDVTTGANTFTVYYTSIDWPTNWTTAGDGDIMYNFELQTTGVNIHQAINKTMSARYFHVVPNNTAASLPNNSSLASLDLADFWMYVSGPEDLNGFYITQIDGKIAYLLEASHQAGVKLRIYPMQLEDSSEPVIANRALIDLDPIPGSRPTISRALITSLDFPSVRDNEFYNFEIRTTRSGSSVFLNRDSFINKTITGRYLKGIVDTATSSLGRRPGLEPQSWVELRGPGTNSVLFGRQNGKLVIFDHSTAKFDANSEISFYEMHVRRGSNDNFAAVKSGPPIVHFAYETNDTTVRHTDIPFPVFQDNQMYQAEFWGPNTETRINKTFSGRYINALTTAATAAEGASTFTGGQYVMMELPGDDTMEIGYNAAGNIVYRSQQNNLMGHFFQIRPIVAEVAGTTLVTEDVDTVEDLSDSHEILLLDESGVPEKIQVDDAGIAIAKNAIENATELAEADVADDDELLILDTSTDEVKKVAKSSLGGGGGGGGGVKVILPSSTASFQLNGRTRTATGLILPNDVADDDLIILQIGFSYSSSEYMIFNDFQIRGNVWNGRTNRTAGSTFTSATRTSLETHFDNLGAGQGDWHFPFSGGSATSLDAGDPLIDGTSNGTILLAVDISIAAYAVIRRAEIIKGALAS